MYFLPTLLLAISPIQIDGLFNDWKDGLKNTQDSHYLYQRISLNSTSCLQQLPKEKIIEFGGITVKFSPNEKGYGVECFNGEKPISPYSVGLLFAPTTAAREFELRINKPNTKPPLHSFDLSKKGDFRVVSWNVQFGNLLEDAHVGKRILKALQPDVLLLQELDGDDTPDKLQKFLEKNLDGTWGVVMSKVNGEKRHHQLRSAIASRFQMKNVPIKKIDTLKAVLAKTKILNSPIEFISLHFRCCGGPKSEAENQRRQEARIIRKAASNSKGSMIIAGDWNLVGTDKPLKIVQSNDFDIVECYQPDGLTNATWSDTESSFTPGRLDWMLSKGTNLKLKNAFVLETSDLDVETLSKYDLLINDTEVLSDHLPLVADFSISK